MRLTTLLHILLICSSVMLLVPFDDTTTVTLFPETQKSIVINVHTPQIKFSSDKQTQIEIKVSFMDPVKKDPEIVTKEYQQFSSSTIVKTDKPGSYLIELFADELVEVTIDGEGIYTYSIIIILSILILDAILVARNYLLDLNM